MTKKQNMAKTHESLETISVYTQDPPLNQFKFLFLETTLLKRIVQLGWPVILGMFTQSAINTVDLLMIGRLDDKIAVPGSAAVMSSLIILWAYGGFLSAISVGTQAISARRFSEGQYSLAGQVLSNSIFVSIVASFFITLLAIYSVEPIMFLLSKDETVIKMSIEYSQIRLLGLPSMALMASFKSFYDAMGRVKIHMCMAILMNIINICFNYFFIFGTSIFGFVIEPMGVNGAAWGSVISSYAGLLFMIGWSLRRSDRLKFSVFTIKNINLTISFAVAKLSVWSGLATVVLMSGVGLFNYIVSSIDKENNLASINSSASSIITHIMMLVFMSSLAFGTSTATLVSQSIGAKKIYLAQRYAWQCVILAIYSTIIFGTIVFIFPDFILSLFLPADLDNSQLKDLVIAQAIPSLKLTALFLSPAAAAGLVLTQALYGAGETRFIMMVEFILHFFCLVPLAWFLAIHLNLGLIGCWLAAVIYGALLFLATAYKFYQGSWKSLEL